MKKHDILENLGTERSFGELVRKVITQEHEIRAWRDQDGMLIKDSVAGLSRAVNSRRTSEVAKDLYSWMIRQHRTLQNDIVFSIIDFLNLYADTAFDARNILAVAASTVLSETIEEESLSTFPLREKLTPPEKDLWKAYENDICPKCGGDVEWGDVDFCEGIEMVDGRGTCESCETEYKVMFVTVRHSIKIINDGTTGE